MDLLHQLAVAVRAGDDIDTIRVIRELEADDATREEKLTRPTTLAASATWYAQHGMPVFPLVAGEKRPATRHGVLDATAEVDTVIAWWQRWPHANIGFPTGGLFDVIDVDGPPGYQSLADMRARRLLPDVLARVVTPRGGTHLYIAPQGSGNRAGFMPGVDYRGRGGYVVAPPSISGEHGRRWTWTTQLRLDAAAVAA
jgi:hypothetical protein